MMKNCVALREVLDCASPLALSKHVDSSSGWNGGRGLPQSKTPARWINPLGCCSLIFAATAAAAPIQFAGHPSELVISEISGRTVRVELFALDDNGKAPSTVLVPFVSTEKFRTRELDGEREFRIGRLHVTAKPQPLTVSVVRLD